MKDGEYIVLDIETTGLSRHRDRITEIAAVKFRKGRKIEEFHSLVNPERHIPSFITRLTGIDDDMVKDAPKIEEVLPDFMRFVGDSVMVAHSASFDHGFLNANAERHLDISLQNERLCTRKLANRLLPDLPSKRLENLCEFFGLKNDQAHRAMGDTMVTARIFSNFLDMLSEADITGEDIIGFERAPRGKFKKRK